MNVLLVDDDRYIIKALLEKVNWDKLDIQEVFSANNMRQAQEIIKTHPVDLLISDIEMPQGSGLQLLSWVRQENYELQTIFLTNYADFNYAQKAIELQSFEYYLKPIEFDKLELIIHKALQKIKQKKKRSLPLKTLSDSYLIESAFWHKYLHQPNEENLEKFRHEMQTNDLLPDENALLCPTILTFSLGFAASVERNWEQTLQNQLQELLKDSDGIKLASIFKMENKPESYFVLLRFEKGEHYLDSLTAIRHTLAQINHEPLQLFASSPARLAELFGETNRLFKAAETVTGYANQLYSADDTSPVYPEYTGFSFSLTRLLSSPTEAKEIIEKEQHLYLTQDLILTSVLKNWRLDFLQKIDSYLDQKNILAHKLFQNPTHDFLQHRCYNSIESFEAYLLYYIQTAQNYIQLSDAKQSIAKILINYINSHYTEELDRKTLSEVVFLSPDHLARLFKKETGDTLINYITQKRVTIAKELLKHTDDPIYLVASQVGYDNYSYFSKLFKKETGLSPIDFRNLP